MNVGYDYTSVKTNQFTPMYDLGYFYQNTDNARVFTGISQYTSGLMENTLNYEATLGKHSVKILLGQSYQASTTYNLTGRSTKLVEPYIPTLSNGAGAKTVTEDYYNNNITSLLGRLNYTYDDKYILTANIRRDGSSNISPDHRYQIFPSIAAAWKLHNEDFLNLPSFISELKLRGGWGKVGNQGIPAYLFQYTINQNIPYSFDGTNVNYGGSATFITDPAIKWETRTTRNAGIDVSFLQNKLQFTAEYYSNLADDLLYNAPIPSSSGSLPTGTGGASSVLTNAASMKNSGFEFSVNYLAHFGDLSIEVEPNVYTLKNEVTKLNTERAFLPGTGSRSEIGKEIGAHYGWVYEGIFQDADEITKHAFQNSNTAPGDVKFKDLNNDNVINDLDRTYLGKSLPNVFYGLNLIAKYKGFDFTVYGSGSSGNKINNGVYRALMSGNSYANYHKDLLDRWTPENRDSEIPRMVLLDPNGNSRDSNRPGWLEDGTYFRINTVSLGYSIPESVSNYVKGFTSARVYITCQNVHTFSKYKGYNPDFNGGLLNPGFDGGSYARPRTLMMGLQVRF
jgi:TonB-linked SusC/RagA family outer membrane protein